MSVPPELMAALMGQPVEGPEQTAALARNLRGDQAINTLAAFSGDPILQKFGQEGAKRITKRTEGLRKSRAAREQRELTKGYYDQVQAQQDKRMKFDREKFAADEVYRNKKLSQDLEEAQLSASTGGKRLAIPIAKMEMLQTQSSALDTLNQMTTQLTDPDFSPGSMTVPGARTISNLASSYGIGSQESKQVGEFWRKYRFNFELAKRNEMFGATLTANEQAAWKSAVAGAELTKDQLKYVLSAMEKHQAAALENSVAGMKAEGRYSPEAIEHYARGIDSSLPVPPGAGSVSPPPVAPGAGPAAPPAPLTSPGGLGYEVLE